MSVRFNLFMSEAQHQLLTEEANRTGLSAAELVRRAVDRVYFPARRPRAGGLEVSLGIWRRPDAAIVGRRPGIRLTD
jgi:hypothetical protein